MEFEWDEEKRQKILAERSLDFADAFQFFEGRPVIHQPTPRGFWADSNPDGTTNVFSNAVGHGPFQLAIASPEPATWAMMLVGFGGLGLAAFHRRRKTVAAL